MKLPLWLGLTLGILILISLAAIAEINCDTDIECEDAFGAGTTCDLATHTCIQSNESNSSVIPEEAFVPAETTSETIDLTTRVNNLETNNNQLQEQISELGTKFQQLNSQQNQAQEKVQSLSTGLAGLQNNLETTKSQVTIVEKGLVEAKDYSRLLIYLFLIVIAVAIAGMVIYYLIRKQKPIRELTPQTRIYLTNQIQQGKKYPEIKEILRKAGWSDEDIHWAYKETMKHNYRQYIQKKKGGTNMALATAPNSPKSTNKHDALKILTIVGVSVLLILGMLLILQGITGQAMYFATEADFSKAVSNALQRNIQRNEFYALADTIRLCVQVNDQNNTASYEIFKSSAGHTITPAKQPCDYGGEYDFAVKFQSWNSFRSLVYNLDCDQARKVNLQKKEVVILPSKYILPGFKSNQNEEMAQFCPVLQKCFTETEIRLIGVSC